MDTKQLCSLDDRQFALFYELHSLEEVEAFARHIGEELERKALMTAEQFAKRIAYAEDELQGDSLKKMPQFRDCFIKLLFSYALRAAMEVDCVVELQTLAELDRRCGEDD